MSAAKQSALALTPAITGHITVADGQVTTTTQDIAEVYGKRHDHVLRIVRQRMAEAPEAWRLPNFGETVVERLNPSGGAPIKSPVIRMTKKGFHFVVGKFTGAKAVQHQIAFADEFERMEAELSNQAHDPARSILAQSLAAEVVAVASRTVYEAVIAGKDMEFMRWMFSLRHITLSGDKMVPQCTVIDADANVASMTRLAEMILMPNGMMPTDVELADLASACMQRLNQRIAYRASR